MPIKAHTRKLGLSDPDKKICERFRQTRIDNGLTSKQMGEVLGTNASYIKAVEQNKFAPNITILRKWKSIFKVTYDFIIDGK